ncbi:MAG: ArsC/Spx/MgsR family protein [Patescibacteria group bacterium]|jgi:arsenate reductase
MPTNNLNNFLADRNDIITLFQKKGCTTCRAAQVLLLQNGANYVTVNYHEKRMTRNEIWQLLDKLKMHPRDILRKREPLYRELRLDQKHLSDADLVTLMQEHPELIERPIAVRGEMAILARPVDKLLTLIHKRAESRAGKHKPTTYALSL